MNLAKTDLSEKQMDRHIRGESRYGGETDRQLLPNNAARRINCSDCTVGEASVMLHADSEPNGCERRASAWPLRDKQCD
jgi:hypothetical protein